MLRILKKFSFGTWAISLTALTLTTILLACDRQVDRVLAPSLNDSNADLIAAISDQPVLGSEEKDSTLGGPLQISILNNLLKSIISHSFDSALITVASGGRLEIRNESGVGQVHVPPNAVRSDVTVTAETWKVRIGSLEYCEFLFKPDGLKFSPNATMTLPGSLFKDVNGLIPTDIVWLYFDALSGKWQLLNIIQQAKDGNFYVPVYHFSTYRAKSYGLSQGGQ